MGTNGGHKQFIARHTQHLEATDLNSSKCVDDELSDDFAADASPAERHRKFDLLCFRDDMDLLVDLELEVGLIASDVDRNATGCWWLSPPSRCLVRAET